MRLASARSLLFFAFSLLVLPQGFAQEEPPAPAVPMATEQNSDPEATSEDAETQDPAATEPVEADSEATTDEADSNSSETNGSEAAQTDEDENSTDSDSDAETETDADAESESPNPQERVIYVPFSTLPGVFENPQTNIVLPYAEYERLLQSLQAQNALTVPAPAILTQAQYTVTVDGDLARVQATLTAQVLDKAWGQIPLNFRGAALGKLEASEDVYLRGNGDGQYTLLFAKPGQYEIKLELGVPIQQSPEGREFAFECPPTAITSLDVTVPRSGQAVTLSPAVATTEVDGEDENSTRLQANLGATGRIAVSWHSEASLKPAMNLLASVTNQTLVTVEDGLVHTDAWLNYDILRGELEQVRLVLPTNHRILDVNAEARIRSWKTEEQEGNQVVTIDLLNPVENNLLVELHTEYRLEATEFNVAGLSEAGTADGIHALDVVRESGQIAIRHASDLVVTVVDQQGAVRIEAAEVAQRLQGSNAFTFKFYSPSIHLRLSAKPVESRMLVTHSASFIFQENELEFTNALNYSVDRAGIFELTFEVPEGVTLDDVQSPSMKDFSVQNDQLTVVLSERTLGQIGLTITGHRDLPESSESTFELPLLEPQNVDRETGTISVFAKDSIEVIADQDALSGVQPLPASGATPTGIPLTAAWSFTRRPVSIPVRTVRKPTRLTAAIGTLVDVQPELTHVKTLVDFHVEYAGVDTFRIEVPESASSQIQIELEPGDTAAAPIKQKTAADPQDGWVVWTIVTQREQTGRQRFVVSYDITGDASSAALSADDDNADGEPETADADAAAQPSFTLSPVRPLGLTDADGAATTRLSRLQGEIAVQKDRTLATSGTATGGNAERIDIRELTVLPQSGTLAFRYFRDEDDDRVTLTLTSERFEIQEVVATVVPRMLVEIVANEDAEATYRCRMRVKTSERQRLRILLPANLQVLGAFLNDREIKLEKDDADASAGEQWTPFWVNVARPDSSDVPFLLTFQFLWNINPSLGQSDFGQGRLSLPLPQFDRTAGAVIQEEKVVLWVPEDFVLVGDPSHFELLTTRRPLSVFLGTPAARETEWLSRWVTEGVPANAGVAQFPTEGRVPYIYTNLGGASKIEVKWWKQVVMTLILSVALLLIAWILLATSWENKLGILLLGAFAATLYGLYDSHALREGLYVARFGIALLLGLWILHSLFAGFRSVQKQFRTPRRRKVATVPPVVPPPQSEDASGDSKSEA